MEEQQAPKGAQGAQTLFHTGGWERIPLRNHLDWNPTRWEPSHLCVLLKTLDNLKQTKRFVVFLSRRVSLLTRALPAGDPEAQRNGWAALHSHGRVLVAWQSGSLCGKPPSGSLSNYSDVAEECNCSCTSTLKSTSGPGRCTARLR